MTLIDQLTLAAETAGAVVVPCADVAAAVTYICESGGHGLLVPVSTSMQRVDLAGQLAAAGGKLLPVARSHAAEAFSGVTSACFGIADTGTVVLESTAEDVRLASSLPTRHFVLLDKRKIVADGLAAVEPLRRMHQAQPRNYLAYITGPSRTADIERVLTIGVHGPKELHILLLDGWSDDLLEM